MGTITTVYTYILKSGMYYKIGKAKNVEKRVNDIKIGNPDVQLIKTIQGNFEKQLHKHFKDKHYKGEWFNINEEDVNNIDCLLQTFTEITYPTIIKLKNAHVYNNFENIEWIKNFKNITDFYVYMILLEYKHKDIVIFTTLQIEEAACFLNVCSKTIRNSLNSLIENNLIKKLKSSCYKLELEIKIKK